MSQTRRFRAVPEKMPAPATVLELFKPVTWFAAMWAYLCGAVSSGVPLSGRLVWVVGGMILAGPLVCAASQAVNDWFDRHVDAINEPDRPIPSGRMPGRWGLWLAIFWSAFSLVFSMALGLWAFVATCAAVVLAWAYSAPPVRLKKNGWYGNAAVGFSYEGIAWFTGAAVLLQTFPPVPVILFALLYSIGAHGIMTLNDFKALEGDRRVNIRTLPVQLGPETAARVACVVMGMPQVIVAVLLAGWGHKLSALIVLGFVAGQVFLMQRLLEDPRARAPWYNGTGVVLYVAGMMVAALAVRSITL